MTATSEMSESSKLTTIIPAEHSGWRLDRSLATLFPEYSRARLQVWITQQLVTVDGNAYSRRHIVRGGESVVIQPVIEDVNVENQAEDIALEIAFEDEHLLVLNKPAGLVVHPGAGNRSGTLLNALLHYDHRFSSVPRAGIVHRLDKDTSGLMVAAKSLVTHAALVEQMQNHKIQRHYYAVVRGQLISGGKIDKPIGRHPHDRIKMAISDKGKSAVTHYKIIEKFSRHTWVEAQLETGRTHQIRVHFASINNPLVGDATYAQRVQRVANVAPELNDCLCTFPRQALHAHQLSLRHPVTQQQLQWNARVPEDMELLLGMLRQHSVA